MHRQSLGSPTSKHPHHPYGVVKDNDDPVKLTAAVTETSSLLYEEDEEYKTRKTPPSKPAEKYIHVIPLLTVICFLILYLSSHDPSLKDLAEFNGFKRLQKPTDTDDMEQLLDIKTSEILAIRSLKNMQEIHNEGSTKYHLPRKIGDF